MIITVIDKSTSKVVWLEEHPTEHTALRAVEELKKNNFNPRFFKFSIKPI